MPDAPLTGTARPHVIIIAGMARDRTIGDAGGIPWHYTEDMRNFKAASAGSALVMGRRTMESIGRALPGRNTIVLSSDPDACVARWPGVAAADSIERALQVAAELGETRVTIAGGAGIYAAALSIADEMLLSFVPEDGGGDTRFPEWDAEAWREVERKTVERIQVVRYLPA